MMRSNRIGVWLELGRVSNLPTVWSNVIAAGILAGAAGGVTGWAGWAEFGWKCLGVSLLYLGGMFLNDAWDADWDRVHRPERPVPSGRISRQAVWVWATGLFAAGLGTLWAVRPELLALGVALVLAIFLYTASHKRTAWAVLPMSGCRVVAYWIGGTVGAAWLPVGAAMAIGVAGAVYILGLTLVARGESLGGRVRPGRVLGLFLVSAVAALAIALIWSGSVAWMSVWAVLFLAWGGSIASGAAQGRLSTGAVVGRLLAGIPLLDGLIAGSFLGWKSVIFLACFLLALLGQRRVAAT